MRVVVCSDADRVGYEASRQVIAAMREQLAKGDRFVLGLATGTTPLLLYGQLIAAFYAGEISFARVHTVNLDEYVGLAPNHPQSYRYFMVHNLFQYTDINLAQTHLPNGLARDLVGECARYEGLVAEIGVDLGILGIGRDGHIAFNEPGSDRASKTRSIVLSEDTIQANSRFFDRPEDVPTRALTVGISTILDHSRTLVLLATGHAKATAVARALLEPVSPAVPAGYLREHADCTFYVDRAAAKELLDRGGDERSADLQIARVD